MINQTSLISASDKIVFTNINNYDEASIGTGLIYSLDILVNGNLALGLDQHIKIYNITNWNSNPIATCGSSLG
jgi:hypothetical protein